MCLTILERSALKGQVPMSEPHRLRLISTKRLYLTPLLKDSSIIVPYSEFVIHKINKLHERGLRALLNYGTSTFNDMLSKSNDNIIHAKKYS